MAWGTDERWGEPSGGLALDRSDCGKLREADKRGVQRVLGARFDDIDRGSREQSRAAFQEIQKQGLETVTPSDEQRAEWKRYADKATAELVREGQITQPMLDRLNQALSDYRAR